MAKKYFIGYSTTDAKNAGDVRHHNVELVKKDLRNHFYTRKGERVMAPTYGFIGWELLFETHIRSNIEMIVNDAKRIVNSDPRVNLLDIKVREFEYGVGIWMRLQFEPDNIEEEMYLTFKRNNDLNSPIYPDNE